MEKRVLEIMFALLLLIGMLTSAFNIQLVECEPRIIKVPDDYSKIQDAVNAASSGDIIYVYRGYYPENVIVDKSVWLIGVSCPGLAAFNVVANNVYIHGFRFSSPWGFPYGRAIVLNGVSGCKISDVTLGVDEGSGIVLTNASNNVLTRCYVWGLIWGGGIVFEWSSNNTIFGNTVEASYGPSIYLQDSSDNKFFHNQFYVYSAAQVAIRGGSINVWDAGYPYGGNYWNDYNGTDFYKGPYQNETGSDEIGDTPYVIDQNNQDRYPLMNPEYYLPVGIEDIAVLGVTISKTVVGQGYNVGMDVTVANQGNYIETFDVSVNADTTSIALKSVTLTSGASTTITFTWNTTAFAKANYTISAQVLQFPEESDTTDNVNADSTVLVTISGDVNGDRTVDILDAATISAHWYPGPPIGPLGYGSDADIDNDGAVNIVDASILSAHWGQSW
jgi:parallel beta-helix repeat protein